MKKKAVVFFARDFLSVAFASLYDDRTDLEKIFITIGPREKEVIIKTAKKFNRIIDLSSVNKDNVDLDQGDIEFTMCSSKDRYLRYASWNEIESLTFVLSTVTRQLCSEFEIKYYYDEPVSGYINDYFNTVFTENGAECMHFQTCWLPDYMFLTADAAQSEPKKLRVTSNGRELVSKHISKRIMGGALPKYVLNYNSNLKKFFDIITLILKIIGKKTVRRNQFFIDRNYKPDLFHLSCLIRSMITKYDKISFVDNSKHYILFPLHYEPESILGYFSSYNRQVDLVNELLDCLPLHTEIVLKEHPSQPGALGMSQWSEITANKKVRMLKATEKLDFLYGNNLKVITLGSTLGIEAALKGIQVYVLGHVHYLEAPGITRIERANEIFRTPASKCDIQSFINWYGRFLDDYCVLCAFDTNNPDFSPLQIPRTKEASR